MVSPSTTRVTTMGAASVVVSGVVVSELVVVGVIAAPVVSVEPLLLSSSAGNAMPIAMRKTMIAAAIRPTLPFQERAFQKARHRDGGCDGGGLTTLPNRMT
jgi:hypothetical protein